MRYYTNIPYKTQDEAIEIEEWCEDSIKGIWIITPLTTSLQLFMDDLTDAAVVKLTWGTKVYEIGENLEVKNV